MLLSKVFASEFKLVKFLVYWVLMEQEKQHLFLYLLDYILQQKEMHGSEDLILRAVYPQSNLI